MRPLALAAALLPLVTLASPGAGAEEPRPLATKITAVTVYADRARVTRAAPVKLSAAAERVLIGGLPGWIDEESVRAALSPASAGRILDVTVQRRFLAEASEEAVRAAEAAVHAASDQLAALNDEQGVLQAEVAQLEAIRAFSTDKLPRDMATRDVKVETFGSTVAYVTETLRKDRRLLRELATKRRALEPELRAKQKAWNELRAKAQLEQRDVVVELEGPGRATLELTYLTPGAGWEPVAELRSSPGDSVGLTQLALVVQTTGEDWEGATLAFSTQRPAETLQVPEVSALLLGDAGSSLGEVIGRMGASFQKAQSAYAQQNELANRDKAGYREGLQRQQAIQARSTATFETLARRGTTAHFAARSSRPVRSDGKPVRVPIASETFAVKPKLVAVPVLSLNAVRTAEIENTSEQPILPGKVALFAEGAFVGNTELPFVAPGETFSAYLGVHDRVKLSRNLDRRKSGLDRGRRTTDLTVSYIVTAENLGDTPVTLELGDRVPVAAVDDIEVQSVKIPDGAKRDRDGIVRWTVTLPPRSSKSWRVGFRLEYPSDLLARSAGKRRSAPAKARMLFDDIESLEKSF